MGTRLLRDIERAMSWSPNFVYGGDRGIDHLADLASQEADGTGQDL